MKYQVPCNEGCGTIVERSIPIKKATCFGCKEKRSRVYARLYSAHTRGGDWHPRNMDDIKRGSRERLSAFAKRIEKVRKMRAKAKVEAEKAEAERKARIAREAQARRDREMLIVEMRLDGRSLEEIGTAMVPVVTRERIRQVLARVALREGIVFPHKNRRLPRIETICMRQGCGKVIVVREDKFRGHGKHACSQACYGRYWRPDGTRMAKNEIARWQYHNLPGRKEMAGVATRRYHKWAIANRPGYKEAFMKYQREYHEKHRNDPVYIARIKASQKRAIEKFRLRMKTDPAFAEEVRRKARIRYRKRLENKNNQQKQ